jgi:hypothetical protein
MNLVESIESLKAAMARHGIERFGIKILDIEDADKIRPLLEEITSVHHSTQLRPIAYTAKIKDVLLTWPNKVQAEWKDPEAMAERARIKRIREEADRIAEAARAQYLQDYGVSE